jgi:fatty-acid desaturase
MLTHQAFDGPVWFRRLLTLWGTVAIQRGPIVWVADHRLHHTKSDTDEDLHNALRGFWWSHLFWMIRPETKYTDEELARKYAPDLLKDPFMRFMDKYYWVTAVIIGVGLYLYGGLPMFLWGFCLRLTCSYHATWFVNSAAHIWGYRPFKNEIATNNWWVGLLAMGEGWHNTHHALPTSARHGLRWWEVDVSWMIIWTFSKLGLARKVKLPSPQQLPWIEKDDLLSSTRVGMSPVRK